VGLCLVVTCALSALVATSASAEALPEFYQCAATKKVGKPAKYVGHYSGKHCEESSYDTEGGQKYEFEPWNEAGKGGANKVKEFKGKRGTSFFEIVGLGPIACSKSRDTGEVTGPKTLGEIQIVLTGCELNRISCKSEGALAGEIRLNPLKGEVGYFDEVFGKPETRGVGVDLMPESGSREAEGIRCSTLLLWIEGSVIGEVVPPYNVFTKEVKLRFTESAGKQAIQSFEGVPQDTLLTGVWAGWWEPPIGTGLSGEVKNKGEDLELKA
jgi:hypothetical protein